MSRLQFMPLAISAAVGVWFVAGCGGTPSIPSPPLPTVTSVALLITSTPLPPTIKAATPSAIPSAATVTLTPPPDTAWKNFNSTRYGYSMSYPADWSVIEEKGDWHSGLVLLPYSTGSDTFVAPRGGDSVFVGVQPLAAGTTLDNWIETYVALIKRIYPQCGVSATKEATTVGGEAGTTYAWHCGTFENVILTFVEHNQKVVFVSWLSGTGHESDDRATFAKFLASFKFTQ